MTVQQWSTTASSNNAAPPTGAPEGQSPGSVNNVMREMMASVAIESQVNRVKYLNSVSGTNTITASMTPALTAYSPGMEVVFTPANANSGATTLNIDGLGAVSVVKTGGAALIANDLTTTAPARAVLNGAMNAFHLQNPQASIGGIATTDFARLSQSNTFTGSPAISVQAAIPVFRLLETGVTANNGNWINYANNETLVFAAQNDAATVDGFWLTVDRTGTTIDSINLTATAVQTNGIEVGFRDIPQNSQSGNYTTVIGDAGKHIYHASGAGAGDTYTIPANASVAYPVGASLTFVNSDSNSVSIAITSDTMTLAGTTTTGTRTLAQNGMATAVKVTSTSWLISGTGLS